MFQTATDSMLCPFMSFNVDFRCFQSHIVLKETIVVTAHINQRTQMMAVLAYSKRVNYSPVNFTLKLYAQTQLFIL